ncbi:MAG TPA: porin family protein [Hymenobacter sp.]|jgi:hypothetical protein
MKKTVLSFLLLAGLHGSARAQGSDVSLGLKAGASLSNLTGADAKAFENLFGFHAGIFANLGITSLVAFQPELLYSQKGAKLPINGTNEDLTLRLHYVDVPLAFHVNTDGLFFEAGPQVGFLVAANSKFGNASTDIKSNYNTVDFGYLAGLGYQRKAGLGIGLRYNGGFTNIRKEVTIGSTKIQDRARNSAFQLYLTYSLNGR